MNKIDAIQIFESLEHFPSTPYESVQLASQLWSDRLYITKEALSSAKDFRKGSAAETWNILRLMATELWSIIFEGDRKEYWTTFQNQTGYEVAVRCTGATKKNPRLRNVRQRRYKNQWIDITPNVKGKNRKAGQCLRVHFYIDEEDRLLVIGHCGDHLLTQGTDKRKER